MPLHSRFTAQEKFAIARSGYLHELGLLRETMHHPLFPELLPAFTDFRRYLGAQEAQQSANSLYAALKSDEELLLAGERMEAEAARLLTGANLAASCAIFHGWTVQRQELDSCAHEELVRTAAAVQGAELGVLADSMAVRLNHGDAVRVAQIVKGLGLLPDAPESYRQLALCAGMGRRDQHGFHCLPGIGPVAPGADFSVSTALNLAVLPRVPQRICLVDNDPGLAAGYAEINARPGDQWLAMHADLHAALQGLAARVTAREIPDFNLVTLYRLEPQAIVSVDELLAELLSVTAPGAHFIATVGAGDNATELSQRFAMLDALQSAMQDRGFDPLRVCLSSACEESGQQLPQFGCPEYASFDLLYCQLAVA